MTTRTPFRISSALKDLIGQGLITSDYVAVSELVKNSFDAHASTVRVLFQDDRILIADDGKGMSKDDIFSKWLFVAYSAKQAGTEDENYRHKIAAKRPFAGSKGVGRFSCDRLGARLRLLSRASGQPVQILTTDWTQYEVDATTEFETVEVGHEEAEDFPPLRPLAVAKTGTVLEITELRSSWQRKKLQDLKQELAKLINPFSVGPPRFRIEIIAAAERDADEMDAAKADQGKVGPLAVNGWVENPILDVLAERTTSVKVRLVGKGEELESVLEDRGDLIYHIRERNPYPGLRDTELSAQIYYLNRSAKTVFARRMGLHSIAFGSVFLYRNGFRAYPIGEQHDDFFGLARRKQQGVRRFLGTRDVIGRVEIAGVDGFDEATSRDQGLIRTPEVEELIRCVREKCVVRLERYVVDISWKDKLDQDLADTSRIRLDEGSARVAELVSRLADSADVELLEYNRELVRLIDERSEAFETSLRALEVLAEKTGDRALQVKVAEAKARMRALKAAEEDARRAERRAEKRAEAAEAEVAAAEERLAAERARSEFLVAAASLDEDTVLNLHHQIAMHAADVHIGVRRMMGKLRKARGVGKPEWIDFLERVAFRNSQILTASRFATKGGYRQQSAQIDADLAVYVRDYIANVASLWAPRGVSIEVRGPAVSAMRRFRPIEVGIVIDNLVSNAAKAKASQVVFILKQGMGPEPDLEMTIADDGVGWSKGIKPVARAFEKGVTTTNGSGLGLYHVKQVVERLGGSIEAVKEPYGKELPGGRFEVRVPA